ncbi:MAG: head GIN domain-containing protein [Devosia sp.]
MAESRTYDLTGFDTVIATTGVRAIVTTGSAHSVRVEARDVTTLDRLDVSVAGGRLHLGFSRNFLDFVLNGGLMDLLRFGGDLGVTAYVSVPTLNGAEASSGGRVEASNIKSDRFRADASSGGQLTLLAVSGGDLRITASSGGNIEIEGAATELDAAVSSGGNIRADRLSSDRGRLEASSGGHLEATILKRLRANASSGGHIEVSGNPTERDVNSSSGGHVSMA